jgi:ATP-binding cassette subfamily B protein
MRSMDAGAMQSVMILCLLGGMLSIVLWLSERDNSILDDIVYVITSYFIVNGYIRNIGWQIRSLQRSINELDDLVQICKTEPQVRDRDSALAFKPGTGRIEFEHVSFKYENQPEPIFSDFSISIAPGERVALVGASGSGKSTFVKLIQRLYDLDSGTVTVDSQNVADVTQSSLRHAVALVPQEPILFHRSLAENIGYASPSATVDEIENASRRAHAHEFIIRLNDGYQTLVGERGIKLSGGERQRVAIARAILADAPVLILDEATSSLDSITEHYIQEAISDLLTNRTAIIVAHRLSTIRQVDRILVFDAGQVVEDGTHDALMQKDGTYRALFDMQALGFVEEDAVATVS